MGRPLSLAASAKGMDRFVGLAALAASVLLLLGWLMPVMTVHKLVFLSDRFSLWEAAVSLWRSDQYLLFAIMVLFSAVLPSFKLLVALYLWYAADSSNLRIHRLVRWLSEFAKWSMLDVFVVAVSVVAIKTSFIADVFVSAGFYFFVLAVLLSMVVVGRISVVSRNLAGPP
ncbi:MAG: paraquat-inducible protein A [Alphaproteobacteria bacterium]